jgi:putative lipoprotein
MDHNPLPGRVSVCLVLALGCFCVMAVGGALAQTPRAVDDRSLFDESPSTVALFTAVWGANAAERWVLEHNAALAPLLPAPAPPGTPVPMVTPTPVPTRPSGVSQALANTQWRLVAFGGTGPETPAAPQPAVTLQFRADGQMSGFGGCNSYGGRYDVRDGTLSMQEIMSTLRACQDAAITQQEARYFGALQTVRRYETGDNRLRLSSADGATVLIFVPA